MDEAFHVWERPKIALDYHLLFPDWHEQDLRALLRRDRNHHSVIMWSIGNEVGEQGGGEKGAALDLAGSCRQGDAGTCVYIGR
jgi:beta-galactosidase